MTIVITTLTSPMQSSANSKYRYAKTTVNVRAKSSIKSKIVGRLYWNDKVKIIRKVNEKWYLVRYQKKNRYVCADYLKKKSSKYKTYSSPSTKTFKSFEDADYITDSTAFAQGRLKRKYHLDGQSGVWMIGNRYCIAVGSFYAKKIGVKIDLILLRNGRKYILKCITADSKADKDTINKHRVHKDGSIVEFVVKTSVLPIRARKMGDISYAGKQFKGEINQIRVYQ